MGLRTYWIIVFILSIISGYSQSIPLFQEINTNKTGITFNNTIQENLETKENLFDFDYFYNGAGVGIADINNDGLQDIIFAGNQAPNELYINKGDFRFEKVNGALNLKDKKYWSNGVSFVDINNDGNIDVYISQGGPHDPAQRKNLLFINNGDLTFTESAESYGLADSGISTQSAFFDYDKDGDLDCVVMNENSFYGRDPISFYQEVGENEEIFWNNCSHLYVNEGGVYKDITSDAGLLKPSFGLGLMVSDLNGDNWLDIYIANDYYVPDAMYMNQGDGTFKDEIKERTNQISFYGMGIDVADINNDGIQDIFVLDMASSDHYRSKTLMKSMNVSNFRLLVKTLRFPYQYMFNTLQLGDESGSFYNVAHFSGLAKTDWSWTVLMNDFDLDGKKDVFVTNGYRRYALDNDFQKEVVLAQQKYQGEVSLSEKKRLYESMPTEKLSNIIYKNMGSSTFEEVTTNWGLDNPSYSNGAAVADFDNDGDLDLVLNNIDDIATIYRNQSVDKGLGNYLKIEDSNGELYYKATLILDDGSIQFAESKSVRGYMSSSENALFFGFDQERKIKELQIEWLDGSILTKKNVKPNRTIKISKPKKKSNNGSSAKISTLYKEIDPATVGINFEHKENAYDDFAKEILLPYKQSTLGPTIRVHDVNKDGLEDILALGASDQPNEMYLQTISGWERLDVPIFVSDARYEDMDAVFFDLNSDGWDDIYIVTGGNSKGKEDSIYRDRVYINMEGKSFQRIESDGLDHILYSGKAGAAVDFDNDGDDDLLVCNRIVPQMYPYAAPSFIFENRNGTLVDVTSDIAPGLSDFGIINDIEVTDINGDGLEDFLVAGEWSSIGVFISKNGKYTNESSKYGLDEEKGWWYSITKCDINNDDRADFILGNMGKNSKYHATSKKPLRVYAGDMDNNGTWDLVLSKKYKDHYVPFRGKECSTQQMPFISEKFPTYDLFASASIEDVYGDELDDSYEEYVITMESKVLMSKGDSYELKALPTEAQYFPILDGQSDQNSIIIAGNIYNTEVETPRMDMGRGLLLHKKEDSYELVSHKDSGLVLDGNIKTIATVYHKGQDSYYVLAGSNDGSLRVYKKQ